jgi:hypothetical protein
VDRDVIGMVIAAVRIERDDDVRRDIGDDTPYCRLDLEHVHVRERSRIVVPLPLFARRVVKVKEHGLVDAKARAGGAEFLRPMRTDILYMPDRGVHLTGFAARRTGKRDTRTTVGQVREQSTTVK